MYYVHVFEKHLFQIFISKLHLEFLCYDDGCHLRKFAQHSSRKDVTPTSQKRSTIEVVIDKLHMEGHTDKWCMVTCNPSSFQVTRQSVGWHSVQQNLTLWHNVKFLNMKTSVTCTSVLLQVDTEVCEQCFCWLTRYARITRIMQRSTFFCSLYYTCVTCII